MSSVRSLSIAALVGAALAVVTPTHLVAQNCEECISDLSIHYFNGQQGWDDTYKCEAPLFCHSSTQSGACSAIHNGCEAEEDTEALEAALTADSPSVIHTLVTKLEREEKLVYVEDRRLLLVKGCDGGFVAGFPLTSSWARVAVAQAGVSASPDDR